LAGYTGPGFTTAENKALEARVRAEVAENFQLMMLLSGENIPMIQVCQMI
jgi:hypothetical protein